MKDSRGKVSSSPADGVHAAISAWTAELRGQARVKERSREEERKYAPALRAAQDREHAAWEEIGAFRTVAKSSIKRTIVDTRWVLAWKVVEGETSVKAHLVFKDFQDPDLQQGAGGTC